MRTSSGFCHLPPFATKPKQTSGRRMSGVDQGGQRQVLDPLGRKPMGLAPEGQLDLGVGITANLCLGGLISRHVGPSRLDIGRRGIEHCEKCGTQHECGEHDHASERSRN